MIIAIFLTWIVGQAIGWIVMLVAWDGCDQATRDDAYAFARENAPRANPRFVLALGCAVAMMIWPYYLARYLVPAAARWAWRVFERTGACSICHGRGFRTVEGGAETICECRIDGTIDAEFEDDGG